METKQETRAASPTVSVVIASYNMAQYIGQAIESVLGQTFKDLDVHVVDDGSTDDTRAVVAAIQDPRLHYHYQANAGQTKAKNLGIRRSTGELVAFCDADDLWTPNKLALQLPRFAENDRVGVVYSKSRRMLQDGTSLPETEEVYFSGKITEHLFKNNFVSFGTTVVRRRCLTELGAFNETYRMGIDWELWLRISTKYEFSFVDAETYLYRVWPGQMSSNWRGRYEHAFEIMQNFIRDYPGFVTSSCIRKAYAHSYTNRGRLRALVHQEYGNGIKDALTALSRDALHLPAWKLLIRIALLASGVSRSSEMRPT